MPTDSTMCMQKVPRLLSLQVAALQPNVAWDGDHHATCESCETSLPNQCELSDHVCVEDASRHLSFDKDGDLILSRRRRNSNKRCLNYQVTIQHNITSSLPLVGLQVWKAALVLVDFVLHKSFTSSDFVDKIAVELGAGTGLVGIVLARVLRTIFITDTDTEVLDNCVINVQINAGALSYCESSVLVRELDWKESWPPKIGASDVESQQRNCSKYSWSASEVDEAEGASLLFAADVIYSDELTDSFFNIVEKLMSCGSEKVLYLALEKRYNFTLDDLDIVSNGYQHFRTYLKDEQGANNPLLNTKQLWNLTILTFAEYASLNGTSLPCFVGKRINLDQIPQYIKEYERGRDLEIWKIWYCKTPHSKSVL